ncbi:MAG: formylglycine-generating enzyme family protein [Opitutaceae bacterium]|nr:formylglycine-generating enzyme family protein [Opitutaceae bacterium]
MDDLPLSLERAVDLLGLGPEASMEARQRLFEKKRTLLERRLREAATPGLRTRYRRSLDDLTRAYEMIELASTDRDLHHLVPEVEVPAAARAVVAGHILTPSAFGLTSPGAPGRPKVRPLVMIVPLALIAVLAALGLWWWMGQHAESARLAELARLETLRLTGEREAAERARAQEQLRLQTELELRRRDMERLAEEERLLARKREEENRVGFERLARLRIAETETHLESAVRRQAAIENTLAELSAQERDLAPTGGWRLEWVRLRWSLLDEHRRWLDDFLDSHPARAKLKSAAEQLQAANPEAAATEAQAAADLWSTQAEEQRGRRFRKVGRPLIEAALAASTWPEDALIQVRQDEPDAVAQYVAELRASLAYLDEPGRKAVPSDWRGRMQPLARLAGSSDADFKRWQPRFFGRVTFKSDPPGARLRDESGKELGVSPLELSLVRGGTVKLTANLPGHLPGTVTTQVGLEEVQTVTINLAEIPVPKPGQAFQVPELGLVIQWIQPGSFLLGSPPTEGGRVPDEGPQTKVVFTRGFWLGRHEVTQGQWTALMGRNPSAFKDLGPDAPVETVSWKDAMEFCRRLTEREKNAGRLPPGHVYTLPTEAQWEYACRAGSSQPYAGDLEAMAWFGAGRAAGSTRAVGRKAANAWGLFDMHGNVWEWCRDWYGETYRRPATGEALIDPEGPSSGSYRVNRGGSWRSPSGSCRSAFRHWLAPNDRGNALGFRLALVPAPTN